MNATTAQNLREEYGDLRLNNAAKSLLIIEDDLSVIDFFQTVLDHLRPGLHWDYATSAEEAMDLIYDRGIKSPTAPYSLVIADIFLKGSKTGFDSWLDCIEQYPDMNFIITSSLPQERYLSILSGFDNCPTFLPKPLTMGKCRAALGEYL